MVAVVSKRIHPSKLPLGLDRGVSTILEGGNKEKGTRFPLLVASPFSQSAPFSVEKVNWFNQFFSSSKY
jgi:hypothetical protein